MLREVRFGPQRLVTHVTSCSIYLTLTRCDEISMCVHYCCLARYISFHITKSKLRIHNSANCGTSTSSLSTTAPRLRDAELVPSYVCVCCQVTLCGDDTSIDQQSFNFVYLNEVAQRNKDDAVDVVGIVSRCSDVMMIGTHTVCMWLLFTCTFRPEVNTEA